MRYMYKEYMQKMISRMPRLLKLFLVCCCVGLVPVLTIVKLQVRDPQCGRFSFKRVNVHAWAEQRTSLCQGHYEGYAHRFFTLTSAMYNKETDTFSIPCTLGWFDKNPHNYMQYGFYSEYAPGRYTKSLWYNDNPTDITAFRPGLTVALFREYPHNFYHAMTQWFNIFTLSRLLRFDPGSVKILLLDRGPEVHIDKQWRLLYRNVEKTEDLHENITLFENVLFNIAGHESLLYYFELEDLPFIEEFSKYFMKVFDVNNENKAYSCSNLTITLYIRHDYLMHPQNSSSWRNLERKFENEQEIIDTLKQEFPGHILRTLIAEEMSLQEQLELITQTDVLIGMHGCVLTHTLFLPQHAMVLEMYPITWTLQSFFRSMARWRRITHEFWQNKNEKMEFPNHRTYIPPNMLRDYATRVKKHFHCI